MNKKLELYNLRKEIRNLGESSSYFDKTVTLPNRIKRLNKIMLELKEEKLTTTIK